MEIVFFFFLAFPLQRQVDNDVRKLCFRIVFSLDYVWGMLIKEKQWKLDKDSDNIVGCLRTYRSYRGYWEIISNNNCLDMGRIEGYNVTETSPRYNGAGFFPSWKRIMWELERSEGSGLFI